MESVRSWKTAITVLALCLCSGAAFAQTTGTIAGTVKDPSGSVIPGATVTSTLQGTQVSRTATTSATGDYEFPATPVGSYTVTVESEGFKKYVQKDVEVTLGHVIVVDATLQLGAVTQEVTTTAAAPLVETTSTQLGAVMTSRAVVDLPLNARDTYQLLQLQPGVQSQVGSDLFYGSDQTGSVSVNGGRGRSNNFMVNGGDANDQFANLPEVQPSPDTIQEFRVLTNTFDAEFGRNSGSVIDVVTKSGTNELHGDVYEFLRNKVLNSRGFFDTAKPDFKQNQFGGTLGGPIKKDSTFFFGSYEGRRIRQGASSDVVTVPTLAERTGDFSGIGAFSGTLTDANVATILNTQRTGCAAAAKAEGGAPITAGASYSAIFPGSKIPAACFDPTALDLLNQFVPLPNVGSNQFQAVPTSSKRQDNFSVKIDHKINDKQQLSGYYYFNDSLEFDPFSFFQAAGASVPGFGANFATRSQQANLTHTWLVNPTTVNEFRASFSREGQGKLNQPVHTNLVQNSCSTVPASQCFSDPSNPSLGITPFLGSQFEGVPFITVSGGFVIGNNFEGQLPQFGNTFQLSDNLSRVVGKHTLKFGVDGRRQQFNQLLYFNVNGDYTFFGGGANDPGLTDANGNSDLFPNYLLGLPDSYTQGSAQLEAVRSSSLYLYAQDSWKLKTNLTMNYGLRWELNTPLADKFHRIQTFRPGQATTTYPCQLVGNNPSSQFLIATFGTTACGPGSTGESVFPLGLVVPGDKGIQPGLTQTYYKSFAPRIGLAWSPSSSTGWLAKLTGGPGRTSIRTGFGLFYNPIEQLVLEQFSAEPPFGGSSSLSSTLFNTPFESQNGTINPNPFHGILSPPPGQQTDWSLFRPILLFGQFLPHLRSQYSEQYNLTVQREIGKDMVLQVAYVGSEGHRLLVTHDLNYSNAQTCLDLNTVLGAGTCGPFGEDSQFIIPAGAIPAGFTFHLPYGSVPTVTGPNANPITLVGLRQYSSPFCQPTNPNPATNGCPPDGVPVFGSIFAQDTIGNSNYNSLQVSVEKHFSKGLQFQGAYTWSKSFDYGSSFEDSLDPLNFARSYSLSQFDARHRFVLSYDWQLPVPKLEGISGKLADGWSLSGITTFQSGFPIRITDSADNELQNSFDFLTPGEPDLVGKFRRLDPRGPGHLAFDPTAFAAPAQLGVIGSSPRTICCGPGINNFDIAFLKDTPVTEKTRMQFRAEFFNAFNHAQFVNPAPSGGVAASDFNSSQFGTVVRARDPRLIQFALKFIF
ncbi:MAG TPA: carboxypeptidase regulatory-like domain-containing protein [Terriglobia bacterium]|nr:carboxypeptidase regulatory-like domain-containing protein [Terriglobia bacterium]